ncbi:hypothetical protein C0993_008393 [Termitomyces sp. T159_Od127]|nr:hypothetical protein C0993_008393 [Termitomyces sp. T159_Od127]
MVYSSPNIPYNDEGWAFQRAKGYSDYIGSGFVFLNVHGEKRKRNVKDNTYIFVVMEGAVEVLIHQTSYAVSAGGVFIVPRGNFYTIRNISAKEAKLFFAQTRNPEPETTVDTKGTNRPTSKTFLLAEWFIKHLVTYLIRFRSKAFDWYWNNLARRLPFIGSPPILNIQLVRFR